jgi:hypothetical protein
MKAECSPKTFGIHLQDYTVSQPRTPQYTHATSFIDVMYHYVSPISNLKSLLERQEGKDFVYCRSIKDKTDTSAFWWYYNIQFFSSLNNGNYFNLKPNMDMRFKVLVAEDMGYTVFYDVSSFQV